MPSNMFEDAHWVKSSYSGNGGGSCVEWAVDVAATGVVPVRDSKDRARSPIVFSAEAWQSFVSSVK